MLSESDVRDLLTPADAVGLVEAAFRLQSEGGAENRPRVRIPYPNGLFQSMAGAVAARNSVGLKAYTSGRAGATFVVLLFDTTTSELLAILEADSLGRIRTGAASGVATRHLARPDAHVLGVIGSGAQARTQVDAICSVREIDSVKIFSRNVDRRESFARALRDSIDARVAAVSSAEDAVRESDIVVTITNASEPVFDGRWLSPGCHVNAAGSNGAKRREVDARTVERADLVAVDALDQARLECGDLIAAVSDGVFNWSQAVELAEVVTGKARCEDERGITLFESQGIAIEDVICARYVYDRAVAENRGTRLDFEGRA